MGRNKLLDINVSNNDDNVSYDELDVIEWLATGSKDMEYSVNSSVAKKLNEVDKNTPPSVTQSRLVGSAILYFTKELKLGQQERRYDRLLNDKGIDPIDLQQYPDSIWNNMIDNAEKYNLSKKERYDQSAKLTVQVSLPSQIRDVIDDYAPHYRAKSYWVSNVIYAYIGSIEEGPNRRYKSRYERLRTKQQILDILDRRDLKEEEWTRALSLMNQYQINTQVAERLWGPEDSPYKKVRTDDIINEKYTPDDMVMAHRVDLERIPEGQRRRLAILFKLRNIASRRNHATYRIIFNFVDKLPYTIEGKQKTIQKIKDTILDLGWTIHVARLDKHDYIRVFELPDLDFEPDDIDIEFIQFDVDPVVLDYDFEEFSKRAKNLYMIQPDYDNPPSITDLDHSVYKNRTLNSDRYEMAKDIFKFSNS